MKQGIVVVVTVLLCVGLASCATKKVELEYEEPVTHVWTGGPPPPPATAETPPPLPPPAQGYPTQSPQGARSAPVYPQASPAYPPPNPYPPQGQAQAPAQAPPPDDWQNPTKPRTVVTDPTTGATTVVVPDQNPTTQTTLRRRTGWVRGGYD